MTVDRSSSKDDGQNGGRQSILIGGGSQLKHIHATDRKWPSGSDLVRRSRVIISPAVPLLKCKSLLGHYCRQYLESVMLFSYLQENFITKATYKASALLRLICSINLRWTRLNCRCQVLKIVVKTHGLTSDPPPHTEWLSSAQNCWLSTTRAFWGHMHIYHLVICSIY